MRIHYGQNYGYILYRTYVNPEERIRELFIYGLADRANIYFNGIYRGTIHRNDEEQMLRVDDWMAEGGILDILVENQGRINFGYKMDCRVFYLRFQEKKAAHNQKTTAVVSVLSTYSCGLFESIAYLLISYVALIGF